MVDETILADDLIHSLMCFQGFIIHITSIPVETFQIELKVHRTLSGGLIFQKEIKKKFKKIIEIPLVLLLYIKV